MGAVEAACVTWLAEGGERVKHYPSEDGNAGGSAVSAGEEQEERA